jgi:hypothetical protein
VASYQITCAHGQCGDPDCGSDYVFVGDTRIDAAPLIDMAEADILQLWTMQDGQPVSVVVGTAADGRKTLKPKAPKG